MVFSVILWQGDFCDDVVHRLDLYDFKIDGIKVKKAAVSVHTLYLHNKMALLNIYCTGYC